MHIRFFEFIVTIHSKLVYAIKKEKKINGHKN